MSLCVYQAAGTDQLFRFKKAVSVQMIKDRQGEHFCDPKACCKRQFSFHISTGFFRVRTRVPSAHHSPLEAL